MKKYTLKLTESDIYEIINIIDVEIDWCYEKNQKLLGEATLKMRDRIKDQVNFHWIKPYQLPEWKAITIDKDFKTLNQPKKGM